MADSDEKIAPKDLINIQSGGDILQDSFFKAVDDDIGSALDSLDFSLVSKAAPKDTTDDIIKDKNKITTKKTKSNVAKTKTVSLNTTETLNSEGQMTTKKERDPLGIGDDDPGAEQMREIWKQVNATDPSEYKLMVFRLEPQVVRGQKINGYLETYHLPTTIPDIIEKVNAKYAGGKYQIRIVNGMGKYVKSKSFEIGGSPKIISPEIENKIVTETVTNGAVKSAISAKLQEPPALTSEDDDDDDDLEDYDPMPSRRPYRSIMPPRMRSSQWDYDEDYGYRRGGLRSSTVPRQVEGSVSKDDMERFGRDIESKIVDKLENKFDKLLMQMSNTNNNSSNNLFNPEVMQALAPVFINWMDSKNSSQTAQVSQFSDMSKQMANLMQGMQDLVRINDKSKEDFASKEREEREKARQEQIQYQKELDMRIVEQQRLADERNQRMLLQLKEDFERRTAKEEESRRSIEQMRLEAQERAERARQEAMEREYKLQEEARKREELSRQRDIEMREQRRLEELKWREEMRARDEKNRQIEMQWREEMRQKELQAERERRDRELEVMKQIREMDSQKMDMQNKMLEQIYDKNLRDRENELQLQMAVTKMTQDTENKILATTSQMELEKMRHATQSKISEMRHQLDLQLNKPDDNDIDKTISNYLERKLKLDLVESLDVDVEDSKGGFSDILSKIFEVVKNIPSFPIPGMGMPGMGMPGMPGMQVPPNGRVVNPVPPQQYQQPVNGAQTQIPPQSVSEVADTPMEEPSFEDFNPLLEIPKVAAFFEFLKEAIPNPNVTPSQAAEQARAQLSPQIIYLLATTQDSNIVIQQIYPLLKDTYDEEFCNFFVEPKTIQWMNVMLHEIANQIGIIPDTNSGDPEETETKEGNNE